MAFPERHSTTATADRWKKAYETKGEQGLINSKPCPENPKLRTPKATEDIIIHLRTTYHLGQKRIMWYLLRYHDIEISEGAVYYVLKRNGLNKLPKHERKRSLPPFKHYKKKCLAIVSNRVARAIDAKFLSFKDPAGKLKKMYQYTAIDDATRARALKIYPKHNQESAIEFVNYVQERFPFRIHTIQTDNGHEFQAKFHWYCEDLGIQREILYNYHRPHSALQGQTPYEVLRENRTADAVDSCNSLKLFFSNPSSP